MTKQLTQRLYVLKTQRELSEALNRASGEYEKTGDVDAMNAAWATYTKGIDNLTE